jgi:hypothetical protein
LPSNPIGYHEVEGSWNDEDEEIFVVSVFSQSPKDLKETISKTLSLCTATRTGIFFAGKKALKKTA